MDVNDIESTDYADRLEEELQQVYEHLREVEESLVKERMCCAEALALLGQLVHCVDSGDTRDIINLTRLVEKFLKESGYDK